MRFALFKEVPKRQRRKKRKLNHGNAAERKGSESGDDDESEEEEEDEGPPQRMGLPRNGQQVRAAAREPEDPIWGDQSQDVDMAAADGDNAPAEESDELRKNNRYNLSPTFSPFGQH